MPDNEIKQFECNNCHGVFPSTRDHATALAEMRHFFGDLPPENRAVVCDDCWKILMQGAEFAPENN